MNICTFTGRLTAEPELKQTSNGTSVCAFTLAVKRPHVKDTTDFINFNIWRQGAEYLCRYGRKGAMVEAVGALTSRKWQDKDGNNRTSWEVSVDTISLLESNGSNSGDQTPASAPNFAQSENLGHQGTFEDVADDEVLPF